MSRIIRRTSEQRVSLVAAIVVVAFSPALGACGDDDTTSTMPSAGAPPASGLPSEHEHAGDSRAARAEAEEEAGRGATDPVAAAQSGAAASRGQDQGDADAVCELLSDPSVDAAIGAGWRAKPYAANGTERCRWIIHGGGGSATPSAEISLTLAEPDLYRALRVDDAKPYGGLGDDAQLVSRPDGGFVGILEGDLAVFLAVSGGHAMSRDELVGLASHALAGALERI